MSKSLVVLGFALVVAACGRTTGIESGPRVEIAVASLTFTEVGDACYDIAVANGDGVVWSRGTPGQSILAGDSEAICSGQFGNATGGDISYIGTCDAASDSDSDPTNGVQNRVTLWVDGLYDAAHTADVGQWRDPCPEGCSLEVDCKENADTLVTFDLTFMREANQGFFDIAVEFDDIFCSAKLDCQEPDGSDLELLHDPDGDRGMTVVVGFACTADPNGETWLYLDDAEVLCTDGTWALVAPVGEGTLDLAVPPHANPNGYLYGAAVYHGLEELAQKAYWNLALGLAEPLPNASCTLTLRGTAADEAFPLAADGSGYALPPGRIYPTVQWTVELSEAGQRVCGENPLDGSGSGVTTVYGSGLTFDHRLERATGVIETAPAAGAIRQLTKVSLATGLGREQSLTQLDPLGGESLILEGQLEGATMSNLVIELSSKGLVIPCTVTSVTPGSATCETTAAFGGNLRARFIIGGRYTSTWSQERLAYRAPELEAGTLRLGDGAPTSALSVPWYAGERVSIVAANLPRNPSNIGVEYGPAGGGGARRPCVNVGLTTTGVECWLTGGVGGPFAFDVTALGQTTTSSDTVSFAPSPILVTGVSGCPIQLGPKVTSDCPSEGQATLTVTGSGFASGGPVAVVVNGDLAGVDCMGLTVVDDTTLTCELPRGQGRATVTVLVNGVASEPTPDVELVYAPGQTCGTQCQNGAGCLDGFATGYLCLCGPTFDGPTCESCYWGNTGYPSCAPGAASGITIVPGTLRFAGQPLIAGATNLVGNWALAGDLVSFELSSAPSGTVRARTFGGVALGELRVNGTTVTGRIPYSSERGLATTFEVDIDGDSIVGTDTYTSPAGPVATALSGCSTTISPLILEGCVDGQTLTITGTDLDQVGGVLVGGELCPIVARSGTTSIGCRLPSIAQSGGVLLLAGLGSTWAGQLSFAPCTGRCVSPPENCAYEAGACVDGGAQCGSLVCSITTGSTGCIGRCASVPSGCHYEDAGCVGDAYDCGTIVCDSGATARCFPPPEGCRYVGGGIDDAGNYDCGTIVCDDGGEPCAGRCASPPEGCARDGDTCAGEAHDCGQLVCDPTPDCTGKCPALAEGCVYVGGYCTATGELECGTQVCPLETVTCPSGTGMKCCNTTTNSGQPACYNYIGGGWIIGDSCNNQGAAVQWGCNSLNTYNW